jgi:hypothetical protein
LNENNDQNIQVKKSGLVQIGFISTSIYSYHHGGIEVSLGFCSSKYFKHFVNNFPLPNVFVWNQNEHIFPSFCILK